jgi:hypothetical protein
MATREILQLEQQYSGSRTTADQTGPWWLSPAPPMAPQAPEIQSETGEVELGPEVDADSDYPDVFFPDDSESDAINELHWATLSDSDHEYLTGPRDLPSPCPWCRGRYLHHHLCDELRASWEPTMPFGKHRGKPLSAIPRSYLVWLSSCDIEFSPELRDSIKLYLPEDRPQDSYEGLHP